ncbi:D-alanine--D-alanine ligase family protein [Anaerotruncus rubiinfantis]|uniref:D-alanine--D-alanine ligase family protein n=1 Tax=Anaerotruncus rubiinfantis TaxID=1720200 RepID=UPI0034A46CF6
MEKKTVAVIFGSVSSEYEVSLRSATSVLQNIPRDRYDVVMLGITKDGRWYEYTGDVSLIQPDKWLESGHVVPAILSPDRAAGGITRFTPRGPENVKIDAAFPVLHGEHGEDGTIQGLFEMAGIPYVGCGVLASAACMDKDISHILLESAGIRTNPWVTLTRADCARFGEIEPALAEKLAYPMFVKPANTGSSVGVSKARDAAALREALECAFRYDRKVLVEKTAVGAEVECAVLGNYGDAAASVVGEIVPHHEFYDYEGKYLDDSTDLYIPARIPQEVSEKIRETAVKAFAVMGCTGLARIDFFAEADGGVILNELNTIPGFTSISMYPKLFTASGIPYPELIHRLIQLAIAKKNC